MTDFQAPQPAPSSRDAFEAALKTKPEARYWNTTDAMAWAFQAGTAWAKTQAPEGGARTPAGFNRPPNGEPCNTEDWNAGYEAGFADGKAAPSPAEGDALNEEWAAELLGFQRGVHFAAPGLELSNFSQYNKDRIALVLKGARAALASKVQPKGTGACTCPSGDGSLRWPCPQHPPEPKGAPDFAKLAAHWLKLGDQDEREGRPEVADAWRVCADQLMQESATQAPAPAPEHTADAGELVDNMCRLSVWWTHNRAKFTTPRQAAFAAWNESFRTAVQAPAVSDGLSPNQEPKYTVNGHAIVNRASGEAIPADEPVFIFRARDAHSMYALRDYLSRLPLGTSHRKAVEQRVMDFFDFKAAHPERMKEPDTEPASHVPVQRTGGE